MLFVTLIKCKAAFAAQGCTCSALLCHTTTRRRWLLRVKTSVTTVPGSDWWHEIVADYMRVAADTWQPTFQEYARETWLHLCRVAATAIDGEPLLWIFFLFLCLAASRLCGHPKQWFPMRYNFSSSNGSNKCTCLISINWRYWKGCVYTLAIGWRHEKIKLEASGSIKWCRSGELLHQSGWLRVGIRQRKLDSPHLCYRLLYMAKQLNVRLFVCQRRPGCRRKCNLLNSSSKHKCLRFSDCFRCR